MHFLCGGSCVHTRNLWLVLSLALSVVVGPLWGWFCSFLFVFCLFGAPFC